MTEFFKNQGKIFETIGSQDIIIKRKKHFFRLVDLGESIPDSDDAKISYEDLDKRIKRGIEEYGRGRTGELDSNDIKTFFGL
jgi:hypothetical protein